MTSSCACGCGQIPSHGNNYMHGHWNRMPENRARASALKYRGSRTKRPDGYLTVTVNGHNVLEHVAAAEKALGRPLPTGAEVHHVNFDRADNRNENLVICPSKAYHMLLHVRSHALDACGHAGWRRCIFCGQWDAPERLYIPPHNKGSIEHRNCGNEFRKKYYKAQRAAQRAARG